MIFQLIAKIGLLILFAADILSAFYYIGRIDNTGKDLIFKKGVAYFTFSILWNGMWFLVIWFLWQA